MSNLAYRGIVCKFVVEEGSDVLRSGQEAAKRLYNYTRYCAVGFNRKLALARGESSLKGKLPKYPGAIGMWSALKDTEEYKALNDRCASYVLRGFDSSMRSWFSNLKSNSLARPPRHMGKDNGFPPLTFEIGRNAKWIDSRLGRIRLSVLPGSNENRFAFCRIYIPEKIDSGRVESIKILSDGRCAVSYKKVVPEEPCGSRVAAIDLNIRRFVVVAFDDGTSIMYPGYLLLSKQRYFQKRIAKCKPSGYTGKGDGEHKKLSPRAKAYYADWRKQKSLILHNMSISIIRECAKRGVGTLIVGDLRNVRKDADGESADKGRRINQQLHAWPFSQMIDMLTYKGEDAGVKVERRSEANTTITCWTCGHKNKKQASGRRGYMMCAGCGKEYHPDVNAALNILDTYLRETSQGVVARLPGQPSPAVGGDSANHVSANRPTFVAKFDLRNYHVSIGRA